MSFLCSLVWKREQEVTLTLASLTIERGKKESYETSNVS